MSPKYRFLLSSSCLSIITLSVMASQPTHAGFEWTPPEKAAEQIIESPVPPERIEESNIVDHDMIIEEVISESMPIEENAVTEGSDDSIDVVENVQSTVPDNYHKNQEKLVTEENHSDEKIIEETDTIISIPETPPAPAEETVHIADAENDAVIKIDEPTPISEDILKTKTTKLENAPVKEETITGDASIPPMQDVPETENTEEKKHKQLTINPFPLKDKENTSSKEIDEVFTANNLDSAESKTEEITWVAPDEFEVIEGFGSEIPLAMALGQIVPAQYAYSFGKGVNPGAKISWEGGKPWNDVLSDSLHILNLDFDIIEKRVHIKTKASQPILKTATQPETQEKVENTLPPETQEIILREEKDEHVEVQDPAPETVEEIVETIIEEPSKAEKELAEIYGTNTEPQERPMPKITNPETMHPPKKNARIISIPRADDVIEEIPKDGQINELKETPEITQSPEEKKKVTSDKNTDVIIVESPPSIDQTTGANSRDLVDTALHNEKEKITWLNFSNESTESTSATPEIVEESPPKEDSKPSSENTQAPRKEKIFWTSIAPSPIPEPITKEDEITATAEPIISDNVALEDRDLPEKIENDVSTAQDFPNEETITSEIQKELDTFAPLQEELTEEENAAPPAAEETSSVDPTSQIQDEKTTLAVEENPPAPVIEEHKYRTDPPNKIRVWHAKKGQKLHATLEKWCSSENIELSWSLSEELKLNKDVFISGTFENAINVLMTKGIINAPEHSLQNTPHYTLIIKP